jgi:hypothetical protein
MYKSVFDKAVDMADKLQPFYDLQNILKARFEGMQQGLVALQDRYNVPERSRLALKHTVEFDKTSGKIEVLIPGSDAVAVDYMFSPNDAKFVISDPVASRNDYPQVGNLEWVFRTIENSVAKVVTHKGDVEIRRSVGMALSQN